MVTKKEGFEMHQDVQAALSASRRRFSLLPLCVAAVLWSFALCLVPIANAQSGSSTSVGGTVVDQTGAVVPNAIVEIHNPVSGFSRTTTTDGAGNFAISNVPFNPYHLAVTATGFGSYVKDIDVRSLVPITLA